MGVFSEMNIKPNIITGTIAHTENKPGVLSMMEGQEEASRQEEKDMEHSVLSELSEKKQHDAVSEPENDNEDKKRKDHEEADAKQNGKPRKRQKRKKKSSLGKMPLIWMMTLLLLLP